VRRGLIAMCYGPVVRICPPLIISEETALEGLAILDDALGAVTREFHL
jgi:4-aminobutyrate aminotransferase-like enzyme